MNILKLISRLIDYPTEEIHQAQSELIELINNDSLLTVQDKAGIVSFVKGRCAMDILDWQSEYDASFERGRSLSLLLFEHIHGESRDRGQAMIDLIGHYKEAGLDIGVRELPDYIPLFLEFVATQTTETPGNYNDETAVAWLQDVSHIFALLHVRLRQRDSDYAPLFSALVNLSKADINFDDLASQVKGEKRDDTKEAIDKVWEEEMVKFGGDATSAASSDACGDAANRPLESQRRDQQVPISFVTQEKFMEEDFKGLVDEVLIKDAAGKSKTNSIVGGN